MIHSDSGLSWGDEPVVTAGLIVGAFVYGHGARKLLSRSRRHDVRRRQIVAFAAGWITLVLALVSPLGNGVRRSFSAHMVQHELLMVIAAPLIVIGQPGTITLMGLSPTVRIAVGGVIAGRRVRAFWRWASLPLVAWGAQAIVVWAWHLPILFDAAVRVPAIHAAQHIAFLTAALLYWQTVLHPRCASARGLALISLFATTTHTAALGALMAVSRAPWYSTYATQPRSGLSPLDDQHLAGLIMWIPPGVIYLAVALLVVRRWLATTPSNDRNRPANAVSPT